MIFDRPTLGFRWFSINRYLVPVLAAIIVVLISNGDHAGIVLGSKPTKPEPTESQTEIDFNRDIRPILSNNCYYCHGPDSQNRQGGLRLDDQDEAHDYVIVPGDAENSEIMARILETDGDLVMPPPESNRSLTPEQIDLLQRWIDQGAEYADHWSFVPVEPQEPPKIAGVDDSPIDSFIRATLAQKNLQPSKPADPRTLIRRLYLDLTGMLPTIETVDAFAAAPTDAAYEAAVDAALSSPKFGERMALDWLDVARYADTYGYQNDKYRAMWPWRDWVIKSFNENLPFDEFITWQLAGDLLENPSREQILATAFNRHHRQTNEGGSIEEEFRAEYVADRVNTFGAAFLGLTLECSRCHDHKFDPISQANYYEFAAFFNSIDESGLYSHFNNAVPTPTLSLTEDYEDESLSAIETAISTLEGSLADQFENSSAFDSWSEKINLSGEAWQERLANELRASIDASQIAKFSLDERTGERKDKFKNLVEGEPASIAGGPETIDGFNNKALKLSGENSLKLKQGGDFTRDDAFTIAFRARVTETFPRAVIFHRSRAWTDAGSRGYELLLEDGKLSAALIHFWPGNAIRIRAVDELPLNRWNHITMRYDGSSRAAGLGLYVDGRRIETEVVRDKLTKYIRGADGVGGGDVNELNFGQRFRDVGFKNGEIDDVEVFNDELSELEIAFIAQAELDLEALKLFATKSVLKEHVWLNANGEVREIRKQLSAQRNARSSVIARVPEIMVMKELPLPRPQFVLARGAYDSPAEQVFRKTPESLPGMPADVPKNRLGLARWLTSREQPLTSRVIVNRFWQAMFGTGLVATSEDFGLQGDLPTHPELLDFLASDFMENRWDTKRLIKQIVMSKTYRQDSNGTAESLEIDPTNRWLSRGPSHRLSAESIRDSALQVSGLLVDKIGGKPVKPYQPDGLWKEKSGTKYVRDIESGSRRRSIYTYWKRTSPPPSMMTFDATTREVCIVKRQLTNTPLQALVLLNDPQFVEAAKSLAYNAMQKHPESATDQLRYIYQSMTLLAPSDRALKILNTMYEEQLELFLDSPENSTKLLSIGDFKIPEAEQNSEQAALTVVAQSLMNFDRFVMKR